MARYLPVLLSLLWLLILPLGAEPTSRLQQFEERLKASFLSEKEFEVRMHPGALQATLGGDGQRAMALAQRLYDLAGPRLGCRFVESVYLLCLGDQRPYGSWNGTLKDPGPEDVEAIERLNRFLIPHGYSLHIYGPTANSGEVSAFSIRSLAGLALTTGESRLAWVPRYQRSNGWSGYYAWKSQIWRSFPQRSSGFHKVEGIMLGYPDSAVENYEQLCFDDWPTTVDCSLPEAYTYVCGVPIFSLRFQDSLAPDVMAREQRWRDFLVEAYASPMHRQLARQAEFLAAREARARPERISGDERYAESRVRGWSWEGPRPQLDSDLERWLHEHWGELAAAANRTSDLYQIARESSHPGLNGEILWNWLLRGSLAVDEPARQWFETFRQQHPEALAQHYRRALQQRCQRILKRPAANDPNPSWDGSSLAQLTATPYLHELLEQMSEAELDLLFQAIEARRDHPPLGQLIERSQREGAFKPVLDRLRRRWPQRWSPR